MHFIGFPMSWGTAEVAQNSPHEWFMGFPRTSRGLDMKDPRHSHILTIPWVSHKLSMKLPWNLYELSIKSSWLYHELAMAFQQLPWDARERLNILP